MKTVRHHYHTKTFPTKSYTLANRKIVISSLFITIYNVRLYWALDIPAGLGHLVLGTRKNLPYFKFFLLLEEKPG